MMAEPESVICVACSYKSDFNELKRSSKLSRLDCKHALCHSCLTARVRIIQLDKLMIVKCPVQGCSVTTVKALPKSYCKESPKRKSSHGIKSPIRVKMRRPPQFPVKEEEREEEEAEKSITSDISEANTKKELSFYYIGNVLHAERLLAVCIGCIAKLLAIFCAGIIIALTAGYAFGFNLGYSHLYLDTLRDAPGRLIYPTLLAVLFINEEFPSMVNGNIGVCLVLIDALAVVSLLFGALGQLDFSYCHSLDRFLVMSGGSYAVPLFLLSALSVEGVQASLDAFLYIASNSSSSWLQMLGQHVNKNAITPESTSKPSPSTRTSRIPLRKRPRLSQDTTLFETDLSMQCTHLYDQSEGTSIEGTKKNMVDVGTPVGGRSPQKRVSFTLVDAPTGRVDADHNDNNCDNTPSPRRHTPYRHERQVTDSSDEDTDNDGVQAGLDTTPRIISYRAVHTENRSPRSLCNLNDSTTPLASVGVAATPQEEIHEVGNYHYSTTTAITLHPSSGLCAELRSGDGDIDDGWLKRESYDAFKENDHRAEEQGEDAGEGNSEENDHVGEDIDQLQSRSAVSAFTTVSLEDTSNYWPMQGTEESQSHSSLQQTPNCPNPPMNSSSAATAVIGYSQPPDSSVVNPNTTTSSSSASSADAPATAPNTPHQAPITTSREYTQSDNGIAAPCTPTQQGSASRGDMTASYDGTVESPEEEFRLRSNIKLKPLGAFSLMSRRAVSVCELSADPSTPTYSTDDYANACLIAASGGRSSDSPVREKSLSVSASPSAVVAAIGKTTTATDMRGEGGGITRSSSLTSASTCVKNAKSDSLTPAAEGLKRESASWRNSGSNSGKPYAKQDKEKEKDNNSNKRPMFKSVFLGTKAGIIR